MKRYGALRAWPLLSFVSLSQLVAALTTGMPISANRPPLSGFNAVADLPGVTLLREEEVWSAIGYGVGTDYRSVDADRYDMSFEALLPGDKTTACAGDIDKDDVKDTNECTRVATESINVIADHEYVVALLGRCGSLGVRVYDDAFHEFDTDTDDGEDENLEIQLFNWSEIETCRRCGGKLKVIASIRGPGADRTHPRASEAAGRA